MKAVTSRSLAVIDLHIRGTAVTAPVAAGSSVDSVVVRTLAGDRPSWNASTMCLRTICDVMSAQVGKHRPVEIPLYDGECPELPRRPLDLGVGLWR